MITDAEGLKKKKKIITELNDAVTGTDSPGI